MSYPFPEKISDGFDPRLIHIKEELDAIICDPNEIDTDDAIPPSIVEAIARLHSELMTHYGPIKLHQYEIEKKIQRGKIIPFRRGH